MSIAMENTRKPRVFLSYAREDRDVVTRLAKALHLRDIDAFRDVWEFRVGDSIVKKIDDALNDCTHFVIILSPQSINKLLVHWESNMASALIREPGMEILLVLIGLNLKNLPPMFQYFHNFRLNDNLDNVETLIDFIHGVPGKRKRPARERDLTKPGLLLRDPFASSGENRTEPTREGAEISVKGSSPEASVTVPPEITADFTLHLVFLLALDQPKSARPLIQLVPGAVLDALKRLRLSGDGTTWQAEALEKLTARVGDHRPDPLWHGWVQSVHGDRVKKLMNSLAEVRPGEQEGLTLA
ncbi:MAG: toll/interleukin-1 receptor domain-containing protein [Alphaproteobacteria bacterium]